MKLPERPEMFQAGHNVVEKRCEDAWESVRVVKGAEVSGD